MGASRPAERRQFEDLMRKAGFPVCAKLEELAKSAKPLRFPDCTPYGPLALGLMYPSQSVP
jgi:hypothetical protein